MKKLVLNREAIAMLMAGALGASPLDAAAHPANEGAADTAQPARQAPGAAGSAHVEGALRGDPGVTHLSGMGPGNPGFSSSTGMGPGNPGFTRLSTPNR